MDEQKPNPLSQQQIAAQESAKAKQPAGPAPGSKRDIGATVAEVNRAKAEKILAEAGETRAKEDAARELARKRDAETELVKEKTAAQVEATRKKQVETETSIAKRNLAELNLRVREEQIAEKEIARKEKEIAEKEGVWTRKIRELKETTLTFAKNTVLSPNVGASAASGFVGGAATAAAFGGDASTRLLLGGLTGMLTGGVSLARKASDQYDKTYMESVYPDKVRESPPVIDPTVSPIIEPTVSPIIEPTVSPIIEPTVSPITTDSGVDITPVVESINDIKQTLVEKWEASEPEEDGMAMEHMLEQEALLAERHTELIEALQSGDTPEKEEEKGFFAKLADWAGPWLKGLSTMLAGWGAKLVLGAKAIGAFALKGLAGIKAAMLPALGAIKTLGLLAAKFLLPLALVAGLVLSIDIQKDLVAPFTKIIDTFKNGDWLEGIGRVLAMPGEVITKAFLRLGAWITEKLGFDAVSAWLTGTADKLDVMATLSNLFGQVKGWVEEKFQALKTWWDEFSFLDFIFGNSELGDKAKEKWNGLTEWWDDFSITDSLKGVAEGVTGKAKEAWGGLTSWWDGFSLTPADDSIASNLSNKVKDTWGALSSGWDDLDLTSGLVAVKDNLTKMFSEKWKGLTDSWKSFSFKSLLPWVKGDRPESVPNQTELNVSVEPDVTVFESAWQNLDESIIQPAAERVRDWLDGLIGDFKPTTSIIVIDRTITGDAPLSAEGISRATPPQQATLIRSSTENLNTATEAVEQRRQQSLVNNIATSSTVINNTSTSNIAVSRTHPRSPDPTFARAANNSYAGQTGFAMQ